MSERRRQIEVDRERNERARLALDTALRDRMLHKVLAAAGQYDAVESSKHRRQPSIEIQGEKDILNMLKRGLAVNVGRDLERNYAPARSILHQFRVNVVGSLGKLQVNASGGDDAAAWFNQVWSADCDFRDSMHWSTQLQNLLVSVMREGDALAVFDDAITPDDTGKILTWEADQIAPLADKALPVQFAGATQDNGILRDKWGRVLAYVVTGKRGMSVIDRIEDATIYARAVARLARNPWRLNQGRGVPCVLTAATNFQDLYEILAKELQSAKRAAGQYGYVKRTSAVTDFDSPATGAAYLPENSGKTATEVAAEPAGGATGTDLPNYERLESFTGGYTDYLNSGDDVVIPDITRPNVHLAEFIEAVLGYAGASVGLARAYTILRADSSYTAFRGDMILSWVTFTWLQKWLEREVADWVARKALAWAQRKGQVKALPAGWEYTLSWTWPTMPEVDQLDAENAIAAALKNGTTDYAALLGPDWRTRLEAYAEQVETVRGLKLPLSILETKYANVNNDKKAAADAAAQPTGG